MALSFGLSTNIFPHSEDFNMGLGKERPGAATFVVSLDGTGDFDSIQEAIDALPKGGGDIFIKEGTYNITSAITIRNDNTTLRGTGRGTKITSTAAINLIDANGKDYLNFSKFLLEGDDTNVLNGIYFSSSSAYCFIGELWVEDCTTGIRCYQSGYNIITNCQISNNTGAGIIMDSCQATNRVVANLLANNGSHGIYFKNSTKYTIVSNNNFLLNTGDGLNIEYGDDNIISNNIFFSSGGTGVNITQATAYRNIIMGNKFISDSVTDNGTNTHPNGASGTTNLALDDLNVFS